MGICAHTEDAAVASHCRVMPHIARRSTQGCEFVGSLSKAHALRLSGESVAAAVALASPRTEGLCLMPIHLRRRGRDKAVGSRLAHEGMQSSKPGSRTCVGQARRRPMTAGL